MVGPQQPALLHAYGIAADRLLQFRVWRRAHVLRAPGSVGPERAVSKHGMGSLRALPGPLVQHSREGHHVCPLERCPECWWRIDWPHCCIQNTIAWMALGILCARNHGCSLCNLSNCEASRHTDRKSTRLN